MGVVQTFYAVIGEVLLWPGLGMKSTRSFG